MVGVNGPVSSTAAARFWQLAILTPAGAGGTASQAEAALYYWPDYSDGSYYVRRQQRPAMERPKPRHRGAAARKAVAEKAASAKPQGPLVIAISIERQKVTSYDSNGVFAESPVSTGMKGHATPMGVFSVIQKHKFHHSNIYSGAPMPYMQRITWSGIAMHAGVLPGYPASHGCIRIPMNIAVRMYGWTRMGARVVIAPGELSPVDFTHPLLFTHRPEPKVVAATGVSDTLAPLPELKPILDQESGQQATNSIAAPIRTADASGTVPLSTSGTAIEPAKGDEANPGSVAPQTPAAKPVKRPGPIAAFSSRKEGKIFVRQNFAPLFEAPVTIADGGPLGTHVFTVRAASDDPKAFQWSVVSLPPHPSAAAPAQVRKHQRGESARATVEVALPSPSAALDRLTIPDDAKQKVAEAAMPGDSLIVSALGLGGETGLGTDYIVPLRLLQRGGYPRQIPWAATRLPVLAAHRGRVESRLVGCCV